MKEKASILTQCTFHISMRRRDDAGRHNEADDRPCSRGTGLDERGDTINRVLSALFFMCYILK